MAQVTVSLILGRHISKYSGSGSVPSFIQLSCLEVQNVQQFISLAIYTDETDLPSLWTVLLTVLQHSFALFIAGPHHIASPSSHILWMASSRPQPASDEMLRCYRALPASVRQLNAKIEREPEAGGPTESAKAERPHPH